MKDSKDNQTANLPGIPADPAPKGRPRKHADQAARQKAYRDRKRAEREGRRDPTQPLGSAIIDLSELPAWRRK